MSTAQSQMINQIAEMIVDAANDPRTADNIREMHKHPQGAETLRLIVRDNVAGAADVVANALWNNL
jgi:hypothetical protein